MGVLDVNSGFRGKKVKLILKIVYLDHLELEDDKLNAIVHNNGICSIRTILSISLSSN